MKLDKKNIGTYVETKKSDNFYFDEGTLFRIIGLDIWGTAYRCESCDESKTKYIIHPKYLRKHVKVGGTD